MLFNKPNYTFLIINQIEKNFFMEEKKKQYYIQYKLINISNYFIEVIICQGPEKSTVNMTFLSFELQILLIKDKGSIKELILKQVSADRISCNWS